MKGRERFAPTLIVLLFGGPAFAGGLADKVQETYARTDTFAADFTQKTLIELLDRDVEEAGHLIFSKPGRFQIHYKGKNERQYISDGQTLWIYRPREKEVEVIERVQDTVSREALVFLGGLGEMQKEFKVTEPKEGGLVLNLVPRSKSSPFTKLSLTIDPETSLVSAVELFPKSGNRSRYEFKKVQSNQLVPGSTFQFKKSGVREARPLDEP